LIAAGGAWEPQRGALLVVLVVTAVVWFAAEIRQAVKRRPEAGGADWGNELVLRVVIGAGALSATLLQRSVPVAQIRPQALASLLGLVFLWGGVALRIWSFHTLGRYFTLIVRTSSDQPVISGGPYRIVRHPAYTGLLLALTGIGFLIGNWLSLLALIAGVTAGLAFRIRIEEGALLRDLGDRYRDYAVTRKRLIPFIW
jgi:protein-S-isoprenylcysteine O-methyltransferase Ste14